MGVFGLEYPTAIAKESLLRYPALSSRLQLAKEQSPLEIVRLLNHEKIEHIGRLLQTINRLLTNAGSIGDRVLQAQSPEELSQVLAEIMLFDYLQSALGCQVQPARMYRKQKSYDIDTTLDDLQIRLEIYTPLELAGWQLFQGNMVMGLQYLDIDRGYDISFSVTTTARIHENPIGHFYYPYFFPSENEIRVWFSNFFDQLRSWLLSERPSKSIRLSGPNDLVQIDLVLEKLHRDKMRRLIHGGWATRSNSTSLIFEVQSEEIAKSEWGLKIRGKLYQRQCGDPSPDRLRLLVVNFNLGDECCFEFMNSVKFNNRFGELVRQLVDQNDLPYDAVLPALLRTDCGFGRVVVLSNSRSDEIMSFISKAALDRPIIGPPPTDPAVLSEELSTFHEP